MRSWTGTLFFTPLAADFGPGLEAATGRGVCFLRLPPSTLGLARRRRRRRGAQLDGDVSFYASRRRLRAWPGGGGGGGRSWTGVCFPSLAPLTSGLAQRRRRRGAQPDGGLAVYASRRRLWASPGGGGGGAGCLGPEFAFLSFTHRPLDARYSYARSLVPTPSKTVDQTPPPTPMEWRRPAPLRCELNLLGRS